MEFLKDFLVSTYALRERIFVTFYYKPFSGLGEVVIKSEACWDLRLWLMSDWVVMEDRSNILVLSYHFDHLESSIN